MYGNQEKPSATLDKIVVHTTVEDWGDSLNFMSKKLLQEDFCSLQALHEYINVSVRENTQLNVKTSLKV